jgi:hypothetical protein
MARPNRRGSPRFKRESSYSVHACPRDYHKRLAVWSDEASGSASGTFVAVCLLAFHITVVGSVWKLARSDAWIYIP